MTAKYRVCHSCGEKKRFTREVCRDCIRLFHFESTPPKFGDDIALTGGWWETGPGGIKTWVTPTAYVQNFATPPSRHRDTRREPEKPGRRTRLFRAICNDCGALVIGDETCYCQPERNQP